MPCGTSTPTRRILADDVEALVLFDRAIAGGHGGARNPQGVNQHRKTDDEVKSDNVRLDQNEPTNADGALQYGNSLDAGLRRLRKLEKAGSEE